MRYLLLALLLLTACTETDYVLVEPFEENDYSVSLFRGSGVDWGGWYVAVTYKGDSEAFGVFYPGGLHGGNEARWQSFHQPEDICIITIGNMNDHSTQTWQRIVPSDSHEWTLVYGQSPYGAHYNVDIYIPYQERNI